MSGHIDLSGRVDAPIVYGPEAAAEYDVYNAYDGEIFKLGDVTIEVLHTPGHHTRSTCYLLIDEEGSKHAFLPAHMFVGDVGRPDLLDGTMSAKTFKHDVRLTEKTKSNPADDVM